MHTWERYRARSGNGRDADESDDEGPPRQSGSEYQRLQAEMGGPWSRRRTVLPPTQEDVWRESPVDPDLVGNQEEAQARRSVYATRKLIVSVGRLVSIDEVQAKGKGGKSSGRELSRAERRDESTLLRERSRRGEREESRHGDDRDRAGKGKSREQSRKGGQRERGPKGEGKRGGRQTITANQEASWGDYRPPPADRDVTAGEKEDGAKSRARPRLDRRNAQDQC